MYAPCMALRMDATIRPLVVFTMGRKKTQLVAKGRPVTTGTNSSILKELAINPFTRELDSELRAVMLDGLKQRLSKPMLQFAKDLAEMEARAHLQAEIDAANAKPVSQEYVQLTTLKVKYLDLYNKLMTKGMPSKIEHTHIVKGKEDEQIIDVDFSNLIEEPIDKNE